MPCIFQHYHNTLMECRSAHCTAMCYIQPTNSAGTSFYSFSLIIFLFCSTIATKFTYQCSKGGVQPFASNSTLGVKWEGNLCRYEFLLVFFDSCFILFYYSHEIHLPIFETWRAAVRKLQDFKWKMGGKILQV